MRKRAEHTVAIPVAIHEAERRVIEAAKAWQRRAVSWTGVEVELAQAVRALQEAERG